MRMWVVAVVLGLCASACSESTPELPPDDIATVRAMAFSVAMPRSALSGGTNSRSSHTFRRRTGGDPIGFSDEVEYVSEASLEARTGNDGRFVDVAIVISPGMP